MRFAAILGVLLLIGCANPKQEAHDAAQKFTTAIDTSDRALAEAQLTKAARERGVVGLLLDDRKKDTDSVSSVGEATIEGDHARVALITKSNDPATLLLRKEDNQWRVWGIQGASKDAPLAVMTFNFEKPEAIIGDSARAAGEAIGSAIKGFADGLQQGISPTPAPK